MKNLIRIISTFLIIPYISTYAQPSAREINDKANEVVSFDAMEMLVTLKIYDAKNRLRERSVSSVSKKFNDLTKTMIRFTAPADVKGTTMLVFDYNDKQDDMWIFMPALRKTRRIVSSEKSKSFMGSEFTNADMSSPNPDDFDYQILGTDNYLDKECWILESKCKNEDIEDELGYSRKVAMISKENYLCYKVDYYNYDNELFKKQLISDYRPQGNGKYFSYSMIAENLLNGRKSVMEIQAFQLGSMKSEEDFSPSKLEN